MASMTIRNLSDDIKQRLRIQAAEHGHSMEEEARIILRAALMEHMPPINLARAIHDRFAPLGGVELDILPREPMRAQDAPTLEQVQKITKKVKLNVTQTILEERRKA